jgi:hypothetical protein
VRSRLENDFRICSNRTLAGCPQRLWHLSARLIAGDDCKPLQQLAETYGCFTQGFDTADIKRAKTLLEELAT